MTQKAIITLPNKNLRLRSKGVGFIDDEIKQIIKEMKAATLAWEDSRAHEVGVALAAVQINVHRRIIIIRQDFNDKKNRQFNVLLNPTITKCEGEIIEDYEGCLSIKNIYGKVPRHSKIRIKALDESGQEVRIKAEGFLARVLQHEIDHTKGILFVDHIKDRKEAFYTLREDGSLENINYDKAIADSRIFR